MYLFIYFISLHVLSIKCSSSGDRIVRIHHLIPDDVLIQFSLLMMSTWCLKHVERWNKQINTRKSPTSWLMARICDKMHGQQNIKSLNDTSLSQHSATQSTWQLQQRIRLLPQWKWELCSFRTSLILLGIHDPWRWDWQVCPTTSVRNYHYMLCNKNTKDHRSQENMNWTDTY